ncbi:hypothetical protein BTO16_02770 [Polaribacter glomeratus]|uniref:Uncharacterized protein n=1 Tax=Polaribacter glomeratus TaxID=102 RepID=A0A2S7WVD4_9FLAO|nr:hypothetical protein BTO16_02770 [Polaribacter glomeratus]
MYADIALFDTYFVFYADLWCFISAVFFSLIGLNYFCLIWAKKEPNIWLTILHLFLQIASLTPFIYVIFSLKSDNKLPTNIFLSFVDLDQALVVSFMIFLFSIFIHLINFFTSLFLKTK